jgi:hypothetical protein
MLFLVVFLSFSESFDVKSSEQLDAAFKRSLVTFALARGLNGLVSVVQGTEVSLTPAGVGVNFAVGEIVDPVNDMVERFSWVMLMSSVSLGAQEMMLHLGKTPLFKTVFALTALFFLLLYWKPKFRAGKWYGWSMKALLLLAVLRFSVPLLVMINTFVYEQVLAEKYQRSSDVVFETSGELEAILDEVHSDQQRTKEKAAETPWYALDSLNVKKQYDVYKERLEAMTNRFIEKFNTAMESIIALITIFIINSVIIPLIVLWLFVYSMGIIFRRDFRLQEPDQPF